MFRLRPSRREKLIYNNTTIEKLNRLKLNEEEEEENKNEFSIELNDVPLSSTNFCIRSDKIKNILTGLDWSIATSEFKGSAFSNDPQFKKYEKLSFIILIEVIDIIKKQMILDYEMLLYKINIEKEKVRKRNVNLKEIKEEVYTEVMISKNALNNSKKLVVFINNFDQNSFIWSKRIIFNTSIKEGTMLSYVDYFQSLGYDIILANPNQNLFYNGKPIYDNQNNNKFNTLIIPNHDTYENHIITLFKEIIFPSNPNQLYIIGHGDASNGIIELINQYPVESINYIKAIALIDSTHSIYSINEENQLWFAGNVFHWLKLGENITEESINKLTSRFGCNCFSAGNYLNEESIPQLKYEISSFFESH